ncbi:alpha/beta fold hydrolase [Mycobacterium sp. OTB74]|jgi:pimeloyl-ACP methyl ester carboxylesterase|uniref:alpha/beta hydrolase n=1 Tax=Mycobacterium sp. OTB74 TaxID=1853452 RepID=UPI002475EFCE|nr:alpha/beta fold hydrolase [Mycobacterium sp. OTB74]MDH6244009.1 pimeloyl-ACP methyl ester carboxylesterase [Mycobacterium sp. OTB74]
MNLRRQLCFGVDAPEQAAWPQWHISAWLTIPTELRRNELQILVHGAGSDHRYWDWPLEAERYSYVEWAAQRGIATLNIDRIGCGHSSYPPGAEIDVAAHVHTLSQIVRDIRAGRSGIPSIERVVLVGHSMGSVVCGATAAVCADVDAVVLTGYLPVDGTPAMGDDLFDYAFVSALEGLPQLQGIVDDEYLVPRADLGVEQLRYWAAQTDPAMPAFDSLIKGAATKAELSDAAVAGPGIRAIATPALGLIGQHDALLIDQSLGETDTHDTVRRVAQGIGPNFDFAVIPDAGHMLNLQRNAQDCFVAMDDWLSR